MGDFFEKQKRQNKGFTLVEILIAVAIITVSTLAAMSVASRAILTAHQSLYLTQTAFLLEEGGEVARLLRDNAWANIANLNPGTDYYPIYSGGAWTLSTSPSQIGRFTRTVIVAPVNRDANDDIAVAGTNDPGTRLITVNVAWLENGNNFSRSLSFYLSNIFND
jgi:prepilin-type N-terminal cleavage/methylation domain-containing protein